MRKLLYAPQRRHQYRRMAASIGGNIARQIEEEEKAYIEAEGGSGEMASAYELISSRRNMAHHQYQRNEIV